MPRHPTLPEARGPVSMLSRGMTSPSAARLASSARCMLRRCNVLSYSKAREELPDLLRIDAELRPSG